MSTFVLCYDVSSNVRLQLGAFTSPRALSTEICLMDTSLPKSDQPLHAENPVDVTDNLGQQLEDVVRTFHSLEPSVESPMSSENMEEDSVRELAGKTRTVNDTGGAKDHKLDKKLTKIHDKEAMLIMQSLNKLKTTEEKLEVLVKKHTELMENYHGEQKQIHTLERKLLHAIKEKDQLQAEHSRAVLARNKLEGLCRELQRHNKALKEETLQQCREEDLKRKAITTRFQNTLADIQVQIEEHSSRNTTLCKENIDLAEKLKSLITQYDHREANLEKVFKHRDLQQKLMETKLAQANLLLKDVEEKHKAEKEHLLKQAAEAKLTVKLLKEAETDMKAELALYSEKFKEFQGSVSKSSGVYATFKQDMEKMSKNMKKLEKEAHGWKTRFESTNKALVEMVTDKILMDKEIEASTVKTQRLEQLCRAMQEERNSLYKKLQREEQSLGAIVEKHQFGNIVVVEETHVPTENIEKLIP
ncbi:taxilin beta b isoform X1 [Denticeps clupeoides]|uniref:taxilin beta b isoform X1 n=2 Tax=Denticeps clupeoides TaxID=299321 RepID=UPI0010A50756|nr:beta-taxilin-like isoform X1 [Denticeps clupeoides]